MEEEESYDNGSTWSLGRIRLGDADDSDTTFCSQERQYKWQLTTNWQCDQSDNAQSNAKPNITPSEPITDTGTTTNS